MRNYIGYIFFCIVIASSACIEEFTPEIGESDRALVVEGQMLEGEAGAKVRLSATFDFGSRSPELVTGANLGVRDDLGNETTLTEMEPGYYVSDSAQWDGIPGRSYQLFGDVPGWGMLESEFSLMKKGANLENLYYEVEQKEDNIGPLNGVQIYLDAIDPTGEVNHYRWEYEETWIFRVPFPAAGVWNTQTNLPEFYPTNFRPQTCWASDYSSRILVRSTDGLSDKSIRAFPVEFVNTRKNELSSRYSILVKQYSLNPEAYEFWRQMKNVTEELGGLFDPIPTKVEGNVKILTSESDQVIGYFSADGYSEKRIFIDRGDLPPIAINSGYSDCEFDTIQPFDVNSNIIQGRALVGEIYGLFGNFLGYGMSQTRCTDCRLNGSIERPDFWN